MAGRGLRQCQLAIIELYVSFTCKPPQSGAGDVAKSGTSDTERVQLQNTVPAVAYQYIEYQAVYQMVSGALIAQSRIMSKREADSKS